MRARSLAAATAAACCLALANGASAGAAAPGAAGVGDPYFPGAGNGGYKVSRYDVSLAYAPAANRLAARAVIVATATADLSRFNLDFRGPRILSARVNGATARHRRRGAELVIDPAGALEAGSRFRAVVRYRGRPGAVPNPDGSREGWIRTPDGAFVAGEPLGTTAWLPCNNHPSDKALFSFRITVPADLKAVANGRLQSVRRSGARRVWTWRVRQPMATYLATVNVGRGELRAGRIGGIPSWTFVDPAEAEAAAPVLAMLPSILELQRRLFGPYPFDAGGVIVDNADVGYALETQTRPIFARAPQPALLVHEIAHQWFGNSVTPRTWSSIWLNEGFATYAEWLWSEREGGPSAGQIFRDLYASPASRTELWDPPPARPGSAVNLFATSVYLRGAMALHALRERVGDGDFFAILRRWAASKRHGTAGTGEFIALAERVSASELSPLFARWLYRLGKP